MEAFKGSKVVRRTYDVSRETRLRARQNWCHLSVEKGRQNSNSNDIFRSFPLLLWMDCQKQLARESDPPDQQHTLCVEYVFFVLQHHITVSSIGFVALLKATLNGENNTTCLCVLLRCIFTSRAATYKKRRHFGKENLLSLSPKKLGFRGQETVKTPPQNWEKQANEEELSQACVLMPKTLQFWGAQKWVSMTFSDH